ncbi:hypothetical protein [Thermasporomyces composti]|jgi:hypothetical protein|uniref:Uncharacterized protein n=1 Tax=Thermasporomyces composti TaxID=696763 RepID=A0A3D9V469_THECX|nr:hypothetical protein [Thermasporomyces composti]REF36307.1 hypothetical protein DFJ64_1713 [Thermasporomyces composti]
MSEIVIEPHGDRTFDVRVRQGEKETSHRVTVPDRFEQELGLRGDVDLERLVRESFRFLLEREPASSILSQFALNQITHYFPEYPREIRSRLS